MTSLPKLRSIVAGQPEVQVSREIMTALRLRGCKVYSLERKGPQTDAGVPDLIVFHPGLRRFTFAELKTAKGRLSPAQRQFRDLARATRVPWRLWRSAQDALDWLDRRESTNSGGTP